MTEEVKRLIGKAEHALSLKIEEGKSFLAEIKKILGSL